MKYLLVLAVVLVALWLWRNNRRVQKQQPPSSPPAGSPQDMVQCTVCSVHLPRTDALPGPDGRLYCCQEHRLRDGS